MKRKQPVDLPVSVSRRLLNLARSEGQDYNLLLVRYCSERLLYRLSISPYAERFVLKGALLFRVWMDHMHRPTRDLDVLVRGDASAQSLAAIFERFCEAAVEPDGVVFDAKAIRTTRIREEQAYEGVRIFLTAHLGNAIIPIHVDVGTGDTIVPAPVMTSYPTLLDFAAPRLPIYPKETVVAEKLHAMVSLGHLNSRMKDFYDLWVMARQFSFDGALLRKAIMATFERRGTPLPNEAPVGLTPEFSRNSVKQAQWRSFVTRSRLEENAPALDAVTEELKAFLLPVGIENREAGFDRHRPPGGPWR